jgi:hypothetical protein
MPLLGAVCVPAVSRCTPIMIMVHEARDQIHMCSAVSRACMAATLEYVEVKC